MTNIDPLPYDGQPQDAPAIGDNRPPEDGDPLHERLLEVHGQLIERATRLIGDLGGRVPEIITDDAENERASDYVKELTGCMKALEGARVSEKEPFLKAERTVDGFFKKARDTLEKVKKVVAKTKTLYERKKADEERRTREEAEREAREVAGRARLAAEAAGKALEDASDLTDSALDTAIDAEKKAEQAEKDVVQVARDANAKAADLSRTRSTAGAVSSLRTFWDHKEFVLADVDLNPLRYHLPAGAVEKAVRSFVRAGGRELDGVEIFENTESVTR
ncbi:MAG: hypothetical protein V3S55_06215 [Nitrospiraceae bacterium]